MSKHAMRIPVNTRISANPNDVYGTRAEHL